MPKKHKIHRRMAVDYHSPVVDMSDGSFGERHSSSCRRLAITMHGYSNDVRVLLDIHCTGTLRPNNRADSILVFLNLGGLSAQVTPTMLLTSSPYS